MSNNTSKIKQQMLITYAFLTGLNPTLISSLESIGKPTHTSHVYLNLKINKLVHVIEHKKDSIVKRSTTTYIT